MKIAVSRIMPLYRRFLPEFAPLPEAFLEHLLSQDSSFFFFPLHSKQTIEDPEEAFLEQIWQHFIYYRSVVYNYVSPYAFVELSRENRMSSIWLQESLSHIQTPAPSIKTVNDWRVRHLLQYLAFDTIDPNSASAVLILRHLLRPKARGWLPSTMDESQSTFWVWSMLPGDIPREWPISLIRALPPHTLLWSSWPGAAFDRSWLVLPARGAIRWAGTTTVNGLPLWHLSWEQIQAWQTYDTMEKQRYRDLEKNAHHFPHLMDASKQSLEKTYLHLLAEEMLRRIGIPQLVNTIERFYGNGTRTLLALSRELDEGEKK